MDESGFEVIASKGGVVVTVTPDRYPLPVVQAAAFELGDRAWVLLDLEGDGARIIVRITPKGEIAPEALAAELGRHIEREKAQQAAATAGRPALEAVVKGGFTGRLAGDAPADDLPWRAREVGDRSVVTNDLGAWAILDRGEYRRLASGAMAPGDPLVARLRDKGVLYDDRSPSDRANLLGGRVAWIHSGPHLHVVVVTLRCDHTCRYCHASRVPMGAGGHDMSAETAERVVDTILASPNSWLTIEFQGGEPLANFPVIRHIIEYAEKQNRAIGKRISFALVTNLSLMDEEKLEFLSAHRVEISTSLDGPEDLHNANRLLAGASSFQRAVGWIRTINAHYEAIGLDPSLYRVEALLTLTRPGLSRWKEIIDTYLDVGCRSVFLRALNPMGFARATWGRIGYPIEAWVETYRQALDYIIELNRKGIDILERNAGILLTKILTDTDPNYLDIRSPCGAAIGQMAYNYDGHVFTCDEGRMIAEMGDNLFQMGDVATDDYRALQENDTVRALVMSSTLDAQPGCTSCAYKPFCGVCPAHSYAAQASLTGRMIESAWCQKHRGMLDHLFTLLDQAEQDPELAHILGRWTAIRPREFFCTPE